MLFYSVFTGAVNIYPCNLTIIPYDGNCDKYKIDFTTQKYRYNVESSMRGS